MTVASFIPQVWAAALLEAFDTAHVYAQPGVVNRDYEGDVAQYGDTVNINSVGDPTISPYVPNSTSITPQILTTTQQQLVIDQRNYFAFYLDDVDARQVRNRGGLLDEATRRAAYGLAQAADVYVAGQHTQITNDLGDQPGTTGAELDTLLISMKVSLDEADVPMAGRYVILPPWAHGRLLTVDKFVRTDAYGDRQPILNGEVGRVYGFSVLLSNNVPKTGGTPERWIVQAGTDESSSYVEQIQDIEAYRPESSFSDALKGLHVFGHRITRPAKLVKAAVNQST